VELLPCRSRPLNLKCHKAPTRPIHTSAKENDTELPVLLLGSKTDKLFLGRTSVAQTPYQTPIGLLGSLWDKQVKMLLGQKLNHGAYLHRRFFGRYYVDLDWIA
jgi:hypothetical protein